MEDTPETIALADLERGMAGSPDLMAKTLKVSLALAIARKLYEDEDISASGFQWLIEQIGKKLQVAAQ